MVLSSLAAWNSSIRQAASHGDPRKALLLLRQMKQRQTPDNLTFPFIAKACAKLADLKLSQMVHGHVEKTPHSSDIYVQTAMVDMYVKCTHLECAHQLFDEMPVRDLASWNAIISGFARDGYLEKVSLLFRRMRLDDGVVPDSVTVMGLTRLASGMKHAMFLHSVHCFGLKSGFEKDVSVANTFISGYAKCGEFRSAERIFLGIGSGSLSVVSWNAVIAGFAYFEESDKAVRFYLKMLRDGYKPDLSTILNLLSSFARPEFLSHGVAVHAHVVKLGCDVNIRLLNTLVSMYSKCGDINSGRFIFDHMSERSCVTWTAMIGGYSEKGDLDEALSLFRTMEAFEEKPDMVTVIHLIAACGKIGALEVGKWVDEYTVLNGLKKNLMVRNALLDMYSKCGSMADALDIFLTTPEKNVVSWTALIAGYALNGDSDTALARFHEMIRLGLEPNRVTFVAVLQACTHAGFLQKGWDIFNSMTRDYGITPGLDHYACMTDLLGRRGKLHEALEFIRHMPVEPDAGIWGALLAACKIHKNLEVGKHAANQLLQLEPGGAAPYVELASLYAWERDWGGVSGVRMRMKSEGVGKSPGTSMVRVAGKSYSFTVEDRGRWMGCGVFETLDGLVLQMKDEGDCFVVTGEV
ncbi:pentatricopeptide repeat-containing protein [Striga asiatica]|uniref:Pentatricopeptide repeat-containing protein n=1 Tax=Striga asiatica TaxID=4170 RepID=A0A5A7QGG3_STRAF|nr:pentatricopeptide repeat-containing protein [Striga asiatica]